MLQSEDTSALCAALAEAQAEMKAPAFNTVNPHFKKKYADLSAVIDAVRPALNKRGLTVTQTGAIREGGFFVLVTTLRHKSGQWIASEYPVAVGKPQETGSALTYAKRYALSALCCVAADHDDDGEAAQKAAPKVKDAPPPPPPPKPPVHPETGEVSPHMISVPLTADGKGTDWVAWGQLFVAALQSALTSEEVTAWIGANEAPLKNIRVHPETGKLAKRVDERIAQALAQTSQAPKENAA